MADTYSLPGRIISHYSVLEKEGGHSVEDGHYIELWRRRDGAWLIDLDVNAAGPRPSGIGIE